MDDVIQLGFSFPAVGRKKVTAAFDGGRITSDGGVMLLSQADRNLKLSQRLASNIEDPRDRERIVHPLCSILQARATRMATI